MVQSTLQNGVSVPLSHCSRALVMPSPHTGLRQNIEHLERSLSSHSSPAAALTWPSPHLEYVQSALQPAVSPPPSSHSSLVARSTIMLPQVCKRQSVLQPGSPSHSCLLYTSPS